MLISIHSFASNFQIQSRFYIFLFISVPFRNLSGGSLLHYPLLHICIQLKWCLQLRTLIAANEEKLKQTTKQSISFKMQRFSRYSFYVWVIGIVGIGMLVMFSLFAS